MGKTSTTYRVAGPVEVLGHEPGSTFDAYLSDAQEKRLLDSGALTIVKRPDHERASSSSSSGSSASPGKE